MGVKVVIDGDEYEAIDVTTNEDATPLSAGDSTGSVGNFEVVLPLPEGDGPTGTWTNVFDNPSFETAGPPVVAYTNLCRNPALAVNLSRWEAFTGAVYSRVPGAGPRGGAVARFTKTATLDGSRNFGGSGTGQNTHALLDPGAVYTASAWVKPDRDLTLVAKFNFRTATGSNIPGDPSGPATFCPANEWTRLTVSATAPATTAQGGFRVSPHSSYDMPNGAYVDVTNCLITEGDASEHPEFFDGDFSPEPTIARPTDAELEAIAGAPEAVNVTPGTDVPTSFTAMEDRTVYAVVFVTNNTANYGGFARLRGVSTTPGGVAFQNDAAGSSRLGTRLDTAGGSSNLVRYTENSRTRGLHVLWTTVSNGMTEARTGADTAVQTGGTINLTPGSGMAPNPPLALSSTEGTYAVAAYAYKGAHDEATRAAIIDWLQRRYSPDPDFTPAWTGTEGLSTSTLSVLPVVGVTGGRYCEEWAAEGTHSLHVGPGFATIEVDNPSTVLITARSKGQVLVFDGTSYKSRFSGEQMRVFGSGTLQLGPGNWDCLAVVEGRYAGSWFSGTRVGSPTRLGTMGSRGFMGKSIEISDSYNGYTLGTVKAVQDSYDGATTKLTCVSRLAELNVFNVQAQPFVGRLEDAFAYYLSLAGVTEDYWVDPSIADREVALPGFSGELWFRLKQLAVAQDCDVSLVSGVILLRPIRQRIAERGKDTSRGVTFGGGALAQSVEVYWYDTREITNELVYPVGGWNPDVEVLNVNAGETAEYQLQLSASLSSIQEPTMQTFVSEDYGASSVYTVVADDGFPVPPALWEARGGKVEVILNPDTTSLTVRLRGATDIPLATGNTSRSFSLALASDTTGSRYSTLRIVGTGVAYERTLRRFRTGVPASKTSTEVGETIDNPMLTDFESVMRAGVRAAKRWTGLTPSLSGSVVAINRRGDSGNAQYPKYGDVQAEHTGKTYGDVEIEYTGKTYGQVKAEWYETVQDAFENQVFGNVAGARVWDQRTRRWYRVRSGSVSHAGINFSGVDDDLVYSDVETAMEGKTYGEVESARSGYSYEDDYLIGATLG